MLRCDNPQCVTIYHSEDAWIAAKGRNPPPPEKKIPSKLRESENKAAKAPGNPVQQNDCDVMEIVTERFWLEVA